MEEKKRSKLLEILNSKLIILAIIFGLFFITTIFAGDMIFESGNLNVSSVLHVDEDNGRVGIGTASPSGELDIRSEGATQLFLKSFDNSIYGSEFSMFKSRSDNLDVYEETLDGDRLGSLDFYGVNSNDGNIWGAAIRAEQDGNAGADYIPTKFIFLTSDGTDNPSIALEIDKDHNVDVKGQLEVSGASRVRATRITSVQNIADSSTTIVEFNNEEYDNLGEFNSTYAFTPTEAGYYHISAAVQLTSAWATSTNAYLFVHKNGERYADLEREWVVYADTATIGLSGSTDIYLEEGDYIDIRVYQSSGNTANLLADGYRSFVSIHRLS